MMLFDFNPSSPYCNTFSLLCYSFLDLHFISAYLPISTQHISLYLLLFVQHHAIPSQWEDVKPENWFDDSGSEEDVSEEDSDADEEEDDEEEEKLKRLGSAALNTLDARDNKKNAEESTKLRCKGKGKEVRERSMDNDFEGMLLDEGVESRALGVATWTNSDR